MAAGTNTVSLTGTAEANSTVKVFDGGNQIGTATANGSGTWSFTTGALTSGSHTLTSRAMDAAGNTGAASATVAVNIAPPTPNVPAAPKITSFSNDSGVSGDGITNDKTVTLTGTAAAYGTVKVFDGGVQIGTTKANGSGTWNFTTTALPDGNHSLTAKVTDANGNTSAASSALALKIDTVAPTAPKMAVAPSASAADTDQVTLTGTAEANSTVKLFDGTTQIGTTKADANGSWSYTTDALEDGNHRITSKAVDVAGNTSASSAAVNVHVDSQAPTAEFISFSQRSNDTVYFKGTAEPYSQITIYDNGGSKAVATVKAGIDGIWSVTTASAVSDHVVHRFTATVMDSTGQAGSSSGSVVLGTRRRRLADEHVRRRRVQRQRRS